MQQFNTNSITKTCFNIKWFVYDGTGTTKCTEENAGTSKIQVTGTILKNHHHLPLKRRLQIGDSSINTLYREFTIIYSVQNYMIEHQFPPSLLIRKGRPCCIPRLVKITVINMQVKFIRGSNYSGRLPRSTLES